jgi:hypothetical protein
MAAGKSSGVDRRFGGYPSPYFDIASTYVPPSVKELFKWARYFYYSNSIISPIIYKVSEYPITDLIYEEDTIKGSRSTKKTRDIYKKLLEDSMRLKRQLIEIGLDYNTYGNSFVSIFYPFRRYLTCAGCKKKENIKKANFKVEFEQKKMIFKGVCRDCKKDTVFSVRDVKVKNRGEVRIVRWNPFDIEIEHNDITGESVYYYRIPSKLKKSILSGKRHIIETTPKVFLDAARQGRDVKLDNDNFFHFKRPHIADRDLAWGMPLILPVIKDAYYAQILRKGQEAIALDHIVPLRILFPQASGDSSPYNHVNLGSWKNRLEEEIDKWRQDPNYVTIMPQPVGIENFGGDAQALRITPELEMTAQRIAGGMGVPLELLSGGMSWSGSSVSLRVLENSFLVYRALLKEFLDTFLLPRLKRYFGLPDCHVKMADFKMADDVQKKQLITNLKQLGDISSTTLLKELGFEFDEEIQRMIKEVDMKHELNEKMQESVTDIQGRGQVTNARYGSEAQIEAERTLQMFQREAIESDAFYEPPVSDPNMMMDGGQVPPQGQEQIPVPPGESSELQEGVPDEQQPAVVAAKVYANQLLAMQPQQREAYMVKLEEKMPQMMKLIKRMMSEIESTTAIDMTPLPEAKAPRRANSPI